MAVFYVLINSDVGADRIEKDLTKIVKKGAKFEFQKVYGVYDAVLKINDKSESARDLQEKVKSIAKVESVMILTVADTVTVADDGTKS
jgi:hypothetical protein